MTRTRSVSIVLMGLIVFAFLSLGSFVRLATLPPDPAEAAGDAIVVLTGARDRINDAVGLLINGKGKRLLISGVHDRTTTADLVRIEPRLQTLIDCCVDLDRKATNTIGNAIETSRWAHDKGYGSLVVVTSHYHMPRALLEFGAHAPTLRLIAHPVYATGPEIHAWWLDPTTIRLVLGEWIKYHAARLRIGLGLSGTSSDEPAREQNP